MSHISSLGVALYTDLSFAVGTAIVPATYDQTGFDALFKTEDASPTTSAIDGGFARITNVREFPNMGTPPNIVKVPVYGVKQSQQIQGQADAPTMEITLNFVPNDWSATNLGFFINDGITRAFRFALLNSQPSGYSSSTPAGGIAGSIAAPIANSIYYWTGRIEALLVKPSLTDATTATLTLSMQSDFYGAYTVTAST